MPIVARKQVTDFQELCVELVTELTNRPIGLSYTIDSDKGTDNSFIISSNSWERFESFCQYMHQDPKRKNHCMRNHEDRATRSVGTEIGICWAGIHNCTVSRQVGNRKIAMMGGEFIAKHEIKKSRERFDGFLKSMKLTPRDREELEKRFNEIAVWPPAQINAFQKHLQQILDWYESYEVMRQEFEQSVHNVAHEFLIHVTGLNVECDLLEEDVVASPKIRRDIKKRVQELHHKIRRLDDIVNNHLVYYQATPRFEIKTIGPIIYDAIDVYQSQALEKDVDIRVDLEKDNTRTHEIEMAPAYLRRAIHNLVQNAVKYSYFGHRRAGSKKRRFVRICGRRVRDSYEIIFENFGIGIEEDEYELIFERGYQGRLTKNEYRPGSGNGLFFTKTIIELHHGSIKVKSTPLGSAYLTRFIVSLPLKQG